MCGGVCAHMRMNKPVALPRLQVRYTHYTSSVRALVSRGLCGASSRISHKADVCCTTASAIGLPCGVGLEAVVAPQNGCCPSKPREASVHTHLGALLRRLRLPSRQSRPGRPRLRVHRCGPGRWCCTSGGRHRQGLPVAPATKSGASTHVGPRVAPHPMDVSGGHVIVCVRGCGCSDTSHHQHSHHDHTHLYCGCSSSGRGGIWAAHKVEMLHEHESAGGQRRDTGEGLALDVVASAMLGGSRRQRGLKQSWKRRAAGYNLSIRRMIGTRQCCAARSCAGACASDLQRGHVYAAMWTWSQKCRSHKSLRARS